MSSFDIRCPNCKVILECSEEHLGTIVSCPNCQQQLRVPAEVPKRELSEHEEQSNTSSCENTQTSSKKLVIDILYILSYILIDILLYPAFFVGVPMLLALIFPKIALFVFCFSIVTVFSARGLGNLLSIGISVIVLFLWGGSMVYNIFTGSANKHKTNQISSEVIAHKEVITNTTSELKFLGISVNESEENIKNHLLDRGFHSNTEEGYEGYWGQFWLLEDRAVANIKIDSGRIIIFFACQGQFNIYATDNVLALQSINFGHDNSKEIKETYNDFLTNTIIPSNALMKLYFDKLEEKYGSRDMNGIIKLKDGIIELVEDTFVLPQSKYKFYNCNYVIFYNREAAQKRLSELQAEADTFHKKNNDI